MDAQPVAPLDPEFCRDLRGLPLAEIRRRRVLADEHETGYSYLRRQVQGRLDIVADERSRRDSGTPLEEGSSLVDRLPAILAVGIHAPGRGRLPQLLGPGDVDHDVERRMDEIVSIAELSDPPNISEERLDAIIGALRELEREVSTTRRSLHAVVDALNAEVVRRYQQGEVPTDILP
ncbi:MAG TPA: hypothetical protein VFN60_05950 [Acidimicrobiales bacterium]|nr:hypothetical protein [Acidimicrobiales bacterium]